MDSPKRLFIKSITWQLVGLVVMTLVGYLFTGSVKAGGGIAIAGAMAGFTTYLLHEMAWMKIRWGQRTGVQTTPKSD